MENLPTEVLEVVFHPLSKKEDIENCFNVNSKWRHIIENMLEQKSILDSFIIRITHVNIFLLCSNNMFLPILSLGGVHTLIKDLMPKNFG